MKEELSIATPSKRTLLTRGLGALVVLILAAMCSGCATARPWAFSQTHVVAVAGQPTTVDSVNVTGDGISPKGVGRLLHPEYYQNNQSFLYSSGGYYSPYYPSSMYYRNYGYGVIGGGYGYYPKSYQIRTGVQVYPDRVVRSPVRRNPQSPPPPPARPRRRP